MDGGRDLETTWDSFRAFFAQSEVEQPVGR